MRFSGDGEPVKSTTPFCFVLLDVKEYMLSKAGFGATSDDSGLLFDFLIDLDLDVDEIPMSCSMTKSLEDLLCFCLLEGVIGPSSSS